MPRAVQNRILGIRRPTWHEHSRARGRGPRLPPCQPERAERLLARTTLHRRCEEDAAGRLDAAGLGDRLGVAPLGDHEGIVDRTANSWACQLKRINCSYT